MVSDGLSLKNEYVCVFLIRIGDNIKKWKNFI